MKHIKKKMNKARLVIILSGVFALLLATSILLGVLLLREEEQVQKEPPEILEGESLYYNMEIAYPAIDETKIQMISVRSPFGSYDLLRPDEKGDMIIYFVDEAGNKQAYYPNILEEAGIEYENLYAVEMGDGFKSVYKLTYLCMALEIPYFEERIFLSENEEERLREMREFGLADGDDYTVIKFAYKDKDGKDAEHTIKLGSKNINGSGYYFMVDDREYVYTSSQNNYFDYALAGYESFIKSTLVAEGLSDDRGQEPYLTTNFYEWINEKHSEAGEKVAEDSKVIMYFDTLVPKNGGEGASADGYIHSGYGLSEIDLSKLNKKEYERLHKAIVGRGVGDYSLDEIIFTLISRSEELDLSKSDSKKYKYEIYEIEAILTENGEIIDTGTPVSENNLIKAAYNLYIDGVLSGVGYHGVFDISEPFISESDRGALRGSKIGEINPILLEVDYTKQSAHKLNVKYIITEIISIYDKDGDELNRVTDTSIVSYRYRYMTDGVMGDEEYVAVFDFTAEKNASAPVREQLLDKSIGRGLNIVVDEYTAYCEYVYDFITYKVKRIDYFITSELVVGFRFQNSSERDPYYGESLYENLMENEYRLYGLNSAACESVVRFLGGISEDSTTNTANGLYGEEVVAIGLTPEVMEKYGLYAYTVYFELPRQIYVPNSDGKFDADEIDDYYWYDTLGFTLYISEEDLDGKRYVASDMYDVVTKVDGEGFRFLDYTFVDYFARRDLLMMDIKYIQNVGVEFNMEDIYGSYDFELIHKTVNIGEVGNKFDKINVIATPMGNCSDNKLLQYIANNEGYTFVSLEEFFNSIYGKDKNDEYFPDSTGTSIFKEIIKMIYFTGYVDNISESEQTDILENGKMLMKLSFKIASSSYRYVYEFYRNDDRRVLVKLYQADADGNAKTTPVSDFYLSTFAFKKIVRCFVGMLNGEIIDTDLGYE